MDANVFNDSTNPSYQNFMAKKILGTRKLEASGLIFDNNMLVPASEQKPDEAVISHYHKLNSLLDSIDANKTVTTSTFDDHKNESQGVPFSPWTKQYDPISTVYYYYNYTTGQSQWEKPDDYVEISSDIPSTTAASDYTAAVTFNAQNGRFSQSGSSTYWEKVGRPTDREGRQMAAFFDINSLDQNRQEAKERKQQILKMPGMDWRKYKEERKKKRQKISNRWLYEDEP